MTGLLLFAAGFAAGVAAAVWYVARPTHPVNRREEEEFNVPVDPHLFPDETW